MIALTCDLGQLHQGRGNLTTQPCGVTYITSGVTKYRSVSCLMTRECVTSCCPVSSVQCQRCPLSGLWCIFGDWKVSAGHTPDRCYASTVCWIDSTEFLNGSVFLFISVCQFQCKLYVLRHYSMYLSMYYTYVVLQVTVRIVCYFVDGLYPIQKQLWHIIL